MKDSRVLFSWLETFTLDCVQMQELGPLHVLDLSKGIDKFDNVVSVDRSEVTDIEALEDILLIVEQCLQGVIEAKNLLPTLFTQNAKPNKPVRETETYIIVEA